MLVHPLTRLDRATKANSLSDDESEFSKSDLSLNDTLRIFPLFLLKLGHSFHK
jgi:hypothetical protein